MFSKDAEKLRSFVGAQSEFRGELTVAGTLRMDGVVTGRVQADEVILSEAATIKGDVLARRIIVGASSRERKWEPDRCGSPAVNPCFTRLHPRC